MNRHRTGRAEAMAQRSTTSTRQPRARYRLHLPAADDPIHRVDRRRHHPHANLASFWLDEVDVVEPQFLRKRRGGGTWRRVGLL
jgi:hypothetical protein